MVNSTIYQRQHHHSRHQFLNLGMAADTTTLQFIPDKKQRDHVVIFPFLSRGHIIPLLHLSAALSSRGLKVTFITTPANSSFFHEYLQLPKPNIHVKLIPFPQAPSIPSGVESTHDLPTFDLFPSFVSATVLLDQPFRQALKEMLLADDIPICVISDFFYGWTMKICQEFEIPHVLFHGSGVFSMTVYKSLENRAQLYGIDSSESDFHVEGTPENLRLNYSDVPEFFRNFENDETAKHMAETSETNTWGVIVNSFAEMEKEYVPYFESFYNGGKAWLAGPLCLYPISRCPSPTGSVATNSDIVGQTESCLKWLNGKEKGSVVYVSFGTMVYWPEEQLDEIWHGLEASGYHYLWVVRSATWMPPEKEKPSKGLIYKSWAPQREILRHRSVGGFLSHCGWNSVLESVTADVPILAWPVIAEQALNAKFVVEEVGVAIRLKVEEGKLVRREVICEGVRETMDGVGGWKAREKMVEMGRMAKAAVEGGGSSDQTLDKLIEELRDIKEKKK